ncbi:allantoinase [Lentibacillus sp. N15]|uniref:allantoinase n=1 Tax=Lentibacillus songyuanensis TaxID=3136161 RepID=UPI0031BB7316
MNKQFDLIIKNGNVVLPTETRKMDIAIRDGVIVELNDTIHGDGDILDARGQYVMPGLIDVHVHLDEPGRTVWEGIDYGSKALAAGGCTTFFDMPLNSAPPTINDEALQDKADIAVSKSVIDFGLWGGLVPGNIDELETLSERGVVGFKSFMLQAGTEDFEFVDDLTLYRGMQKLAKLNKILALHAESGEIIQKLTAEKEAESANSARDYAETRPIISEMEAVTRALLFAEETGCPLHIVHVSNAKTVDLIQEAKDRGVNVTVETCPPYLLFNMEDFERLGAVAKCAPPLREEEERLALWEALKEGKIDMISSDHAPCPTSMKTDYENDMLKAWGGITGGQFSLEAIIDQAHIERQIPLNKVSELISLNPAKRFGLYPKKGTLSVGADADIAVVNLNVDHHVKESDLYSRYSHSPYIGQHFRCSVTHTVSRGKVVYNRQEGIMDNPPGDWLKVN